jgi:transglutaminase-like putative cysteine protease
MPKRKESTLLSRQTNKDNERSPQNIMNKKATAYKELCGNKVCKSGAGFFSSREAAGSVDTGSINGFCQHSVAEKRQVRHKGYFRTVTKLAAALLAASFAFPPAASALTGPGGEEINLNAAVYDLAGGNISFPDAADDAWDIKWLAKNGVINGYPDGTFKPYGNTARAEFAKMLCLAMGLSPFVPEKPPDRGKTEPAENESMTPLREVHGDGKPSEFDDLAGYAWAEGYINALAEKRIVNGVSATKFNPAGIVTRGEMIKMIILAMGCSEKETDAKGGYPKGYGVMAVEIGIFGDMTGGLLSVKVERNTAARAIYDSSLLPPPVILPFGDDGGNDKSQRYLRYDRAGMTVNLLMPTPRTAKVYRVTDGTASAAKFDLLGDKGVNLSAENLTVSLISVNGKGEKSPVFTYRYSAKEALRRGHVTTDKIEKAIPGILAEIFEGEEENLGEKEKAELIFAWVKENARTTTGRAALIWGSKDVDLGRRDTGEITFCVRNAEVFADLMRAAGLETEIVAGYAPGRDPSGYESHAWNTAKIDGVWYHFDAGWGNFGMSRDTFAMKGYTFVNVFSDIISPFSENTDLRRQRHAFLVRG